LLQIMMADRKGASNEVDDILEKYAHSEKRNGQIRKYRDLLGGRFRLTKVVRIHRKDSGNEVFDMIFDYSSNSIENLMREGYYDALTTIGIQSIKEGFMSIKSKTKNFKGDKSLEKLAGNVQQIESPTIINKIEDLTYRVESALDEVDHDVSIKEEKAFLVNAAKQFKETITEAKNLDNGSISIACYQRESVQAEIPLKVKKILRKCGYPPDKEKKATETVLEQAEIIARDWAL
jgi:hypothetical protein